MIEIIISVNDENDGRPLIIYLMYTDNSADAVYWLLIYYLAFPSVCWTGQGDQVSFVTFDHSYMSQ